ncbi:glycoside hydrolase family 36 N-terminal domain-containing protein [Phytohabitans rumicis]|uniref:Uncharacterized protein n=1 Tax=Phytohabitans rumicis TaxID=1076125 RepID=A0A6V8LIA0_9ACTN|nr:glycoside hydrolase family 36 N-terminal domain-containing protein [Phytohabitans rumicis]GFJ95914.1 hypothetical protein Prum_095560 [Phytohabitans rumicis]
MESGTSLVWGHSALKLVVDVSPDGPVAVRALTGPGGRQDPLRAAQPLVELLVAGEGRVRTSQRFSETTVGRRLTYAGSEQTRDGAWRELRVDLRDERTGLAAQVYVRSADGVGACQVRTRVTNQGVAPVVLLGVTSFAAGLAGHRVDDLDLVRGDSEWLGEGRWTRQRLRDGVPDLSLPVHHQDGRGRVAVTSTGTWSTGAHLPTGGLVDRAGGAAWLWQVEHNGAWRWEVGSGSAARTWRCSVRPTSTTSGSTASNRGRASPPYPCRWRCPATGWTARSRR